MCGFAGIVGKFESRDDSATLTRMADAIVHRGPDDSGVFIDPLHSVGLAFRRLSIQDLSPLGHQPMHSVSGRYVITFNGEVYNFPVLRSTLEKAGFSFRGHSDTEVILAAFEAWGIEASLQRFVGMFAMALLDREAGRLWLIRDRLGVKPLYFGLASGPWDLPESKIELPHNATLLFGSELKALQAHFGFQQAVDRNALALFMRHGYIPHPYSIWQGIKKLPPGSLLELDLASRRGEIRTWWDAKAVMRSGMDDLLVCGEDEAADQLETLLDDAIGSRMIADVPLGAFLSGGVDSSLVVSRMQGLSSRPVKTFSIGFDHRDFDESKHAEAVARHLGTDHQTVMMTSADALNVVPKLSQIWDEPFADASQIPSYLVCHEARKSLAVVLSGDGGDEFFGGYRHYDRLPALASQLGRLPFSLRMKLAELFERPEGLSSGWASALNLKGTKRLQVAIFGEMLASAGRYLSCQDPLEMQYRWMSFWNAFGGESVVLGAEALPRTPPAFWELGQGNWRTRMRFADCVAYLPGDILTKVDRASMAVSLEAREPLLDHRLYEFSARVPEAMQVNQGRSRWLLRKVLYRRVPAAMIERPKQGFTPPYEAWLKGPLRDWAEGLLEERLLVEQQFFNVGQIRAQWQRFKNGDHDLVTSIWAVLMFQDWLARQNNLNLIRGQ